MLSDATAAIRYSVCFVDSDVPVMRVAPRARNERLQEGLPSTLDELETVILEAARHHSPIDPNRDSDTRKLENQLIQDLIHI